MVSLAALPEETVAHIQSAGCKAQKKIVIGAHECLLRPAHFRPGAGVDLPSFGPGRSDLYLLTHPGTPSSSSDCLFGGPQHRLYPLGKISE